MLKELYIENYKSLKNTTVQFKDGLNIVIGKNGSGKSNLLDFIDSTVFYLTFAELAKNAKPTNNYSYTLKASDGNQIKIEKKSKFTSTEEKISEKLSAIGNSHKTLLTIAHTGPSKEPRSVTYQVDDSSVFYSLPDYERQSILDYAASLQLLHYNIPNSPSLFNSAINYRVPLNSLLRISSEDNDFIFGIRFRNSFENDILLKYKNDFADIIKLKDFLFKSFEDFKLTISIDANLKLYSPIEEIRISPNVNLYNIDSDILIDNITIEYKINGTWVPWSYLSDGTKRCFYIIAETSCQDDGLLLIEEPELGIHPHQLYKLMQFIKEQSQTKQIIISTHSPLILDCLEPNELDRIIIAKIENGGSHFYNLTEEQKSKGAQYMQEIGELSYYWLHSDLEEND